MLLVQSTYITHINIKDHPWCNSFHQPLPLKMNIARNEAYFDVALKNPKPFMGYYIGSTPMIYVFLITPCLSRFLCKKEWGTKRVIPLTSIRMDGRTIFHAMCHQEGKLTCTGPRDRPRPHGNQKDFSFYRNAAVRSQFYSEQTF